MTENTWIDLLRDLLPIIGVLAGVALGHFLSLRQELKTRRAEYAREALLKMRGLADRMEIIANNVLVLYIVGRKLPLPKDTKQEIGRNIDELMSQHIRSPMLPEVTNEAISEKWKEVQFSFGNLWTTIGLSELAQGTTVREQLWELQKALKSGDPSTVIGALASDERSKLVCEALEDLFGSIQSLRDEISKASTSGT
ncbi:MAG: hypothetical protein KAW00_02885 [Dehalococcoidia bacterium]|nr:hypothetical protein [Dehalococcoidia bacterium]